eukprot:m.49277 g.49277  ORF g.49277 m.49277 type:complete len:387 (-) comp12462_c1_seq5:93-1253(-)
MLLARRACLIHQRWSQLTLQALTAMHTKSQAHCLRKQQQAANTLFFAAAGVKGPLSGPSPSILSLRYMATRAIMSIDECYQVLGVSQGTPLEQIREQYYVLVKMYHPDSSHPDASQARFLRVMDAFRLVEEHALTNAERAGEMETLQAQEEAEEDDTDTQKDKHKAAAHRPYLQDWAVGPGTVFERAKRTQQARLAKAANKVVEHHQKESLRRTGEGEHGITTATESLKQPKKSIGQIVEEQIQAAMQRGDFANLKGHGKPLQREETTGTDAFERTLNRIVRNAGYIPEWAELQRDIDKQCGEVFSLLRRWLKSYKLDHHFQPHTVDQLMELDRQTLLEEVGRINNNISRYNLIAPGMYVQKVQLSPQWFLDAVLEAQQTKHASSA